MKTTPTLTVINEDRNRMAARLIIADQRAMFGDPAVVEQLLDDITNPDFDVLTAYRDDQVKAIILTKREFPETIAVHLLAVASTAQRTGLGRLLIGRCSTGLAAPASAC